MTDSADTAAPNEFVRYFSLTLHALVSCRDDGTVHVQRLGEPWMLHSSKKPEVGLADWMAARRVCAHVQPAWAREVRELPSLPEIADMITDGPVPHADRPRRRARRCRSRRRAQLAALPGPAVRRP
jgi:hypothetical protein